MQEVDVGRKALYKLIAGIMAANPVLAAKLAGEVEAISDVAQDAVAVEQEVDATLDRAVDVLERDELSEVIRG